MPIGGICSKSEHNGRYSAEYLGDVALVCAFGRLTVGRLSLSDQKCVNFMYTNDPEYDVNMTREHGKLFGEGKQISICPLVDKPVRAPCAADLGEVMSAAFTGNGEVQEQG